MNNQTATGMKALLVLGNQLFSPKIVKAECDRLGIDSLYLREDFELGTYYKFHKHKIIFFLAAMRTFAQNCKGLKIHYEKLAASEKRYEVHFLAFLKKQRAEKVYFYEIEDKFFEKRILAVLESNGIPFEILPSPMFLTSRERFQDYLKRNKKPFMHTFYQDQRKALNLLLTKDKKPIGGKWSLDEENRKALPKDHYPLPLPQITHSKIVKEVMEVVDKAFPTHPGTSSSFWLPVDHEAASQWLDHFLKHKLENFGPYEDAIPSHSVFVYHSALAPFLNTGLLTPEDIIERTMKFADKNKVPLASIEGFLRQIIGWREFIRGIYQNFSDQQESKNFWKSENKLRACWYEGNTNIPPLDQVIQKVNEFSYSHHIERLMVVGSMMLLLGVHPKEAHRWFMEMYIDSSDWVMGPNVYGMALFSDGGIFAIKPYICGSNYYRKMGNFPKGDWCEGVDGLYWQFIQKNRAFFLKNPRLSMTVRTLEKMDEEKKKKIFWAADHLRKKLVIQK